MNIKNIVSVIVVLAFAWVLVSLFSPFWAKYSLEKQMEAAAIYGTKHSIESTREFLEAKMKESGRDFGGKDFMIEKDNQNNVTISITYTDEIKVFGIKLQTLEFTIEKRELYIKPVV